MDVPPSPKFQERVAMVPSLSLDRSVKVQLNKVQLALNAAVGLMLLAWVTVKMLDLAIRADDVELLMRSSNTYVPTADSVTGRFSIAGAVEVASSVRWPVVWL